MNYMSQEEFLKMHQEMVRTSLQDMNSYIAEKAVEYRQEFKEKGLTGDDLSFAITLKLVADAANRAVVVCLAKVYNVHPDPFDPRSSFTIVSK